MNAMDKAELEDLREGVREVINRMERNATDHQDSGEIGIAIQLRHWVNELWRVL